MISYLFYIVFFNSNKNFQVTNPFQKIIKETHLRIPIFPIIYLSIFLIFTFLTDLFDNRLTYYNQRIGDRDYKLENEIAEKMKYDDVCFSYTYKIDANPPMHLAVAGKRVYKINNLNEIEKIFPHLNEAANKVLIIDKSVLKDMETIEKENEAISSGNILFENDLYLFVKLE